MDLKVDVNTKKDKKKGEDNYGLVAEELWVLSKPTELSCEVQRLGFHSIHPGWSCNNHAVPVMVSWTSGKCSHGATSRRRRTKSFCDTLQHACETFQPLSSFPDAIPSSSCSGDAANDEMLGWHVNNNNNLFLPKIFFQELVIEKPTQKNEVNCVNSLVR